MKQNKKKKVFIFFRNIKKVFKSWLIFLKFLLNLDWSIYKVKYNKIRGAPNDKKGEGPKFDQSHKRGLELKRIGGTLLSFNTNAIFRLEVENGKLKI